MGKDTHVIIIAPNACQNAATIANTLDNHAPTRVHSANTPVINDPAAKTSAINTNANINRVSRKYRRVPTNCSGTPSVVPKLRPLGGSKGKAGCTPSHLARALLVLLSHRFQKVQRVVDGAPGMPEVSAWMKKTLSVAREETVPARRVSRIRTMAPAVNIRERSAKRGPADEEKVD